MPDIIKSKKFQAAMGVILVALIKEWFPAVDEQTVLTIAAGLIAYIGGQGLADFGKEAKHDD